MKRSWKGLILEYRRRKAGIKNRLKEFTLLHKGPDEDIFSELCFCLLTANANALRCDEAILELKKRHLLLKGDADAVKPILRGRVRFHNKKACFIVAARGVFRKGRCIDIKSRLEKSDIIDTRDWLVRNVKGLGYKEASHFLRNIGLGKEIAILDRHILKNLKRYGVIRHIPPSLGSRKVYMSIEEKMRRFSRQARIPLDAMDLLFWSHETGFVFK